MSADVHVLSPAHGEGALSQRVCRRLFKNSRANRKFGGYTRLLELGDKFSYRSELNFNNRKPTNERRLPSI